MAVQTFAYNKLLLNIFRIMQCIDKYNRMLCVNKLMMMNIIIIELSWQQDMN